LTLPPHHRPDGGFRNPWPSARLHGFGDFLKWSLVERRRKPRRPDPGPEAFPRAVPEFVFPRANPETTTVTWVGHTTFLLQIGGINVLTDPIWSERASPVPFAGPRRHVPPAVDFDALPPVDLVVMSHDHYDHLDSRTIRRLAKRYPAAVFVAPLGVGETLKRFGVRDVVEKDWWENTIFCSLKLTCVPAQHFSGRGLTNRNRTLWCGWVIETERCRVLFGGDTALHPEFGAIVSRCGPVDSTILPIGAYEPRWFMGTVHMNPEDCLTAVTAMRHAQAGKPITVIASHWGTFKLTDEPLDEPPRWMRELWSASDNANADLMILRHGETRILVAN
jgi:N-acyl-phosphatidylethanolamine-hydrolysing phospholipase D